MCSFWWEKEKNLKFTAQEVFDAYDRIKPYLPDTPLAESVHLGDGERKYFFKQECLDINIHTSEFREATITEAGDNAMRWGAEAMALTALRVMEDSGLLQTIKDEFEEAKRTFKL